MCVLSICCVHLPLFHRIHLLSRTQKTVNEFRYLEQTTKTMTKILTLCFLLSAWITVSSAATGFVDYSFERIDSSSLKITLHFAGNEAGKSFIILPNEWAGQTGLYHCIEGLSSLSPNTSLAPTERPDQFIATYRPSEAVTLQYTLKKDWQGLPRYPMYFRPVIEKNYFYFDGFSGLVYPAIEFSEPIQCTLSFTGFPEGSFVGNSFFSNAPHQSFATTLGNLRNGLFCVGDFRFKEVNFPNGRMIIAVTGKFTFDDDRLFSTVSSIIPAERQFWNDPGTPYFFTLLLPLYDRGSTGGTAHYNSFALYESTNLKMEQGLIETISHEYFHNWLGQGLKMPMPEEIYKWFQEGFTDYYSHKILLTTGVWSPTAYTDKMNQVIRDYSRSAYFNTPNDSLVGNYWKDPALKLLSYQRGQIRAFPLLDSYTQHQ